MKNTFSVKEGDAGLKVKGFRYYQQCSESTPQALLGETFVPIAFSNGVISKIGIETSSKVIGYEEEDNIATITFTPGTTLSPLGG